MRTETIIGIDDSQTRIRPRKSSMTCQSIPHCLRKQEVVVLEFSIERSWRNVEDCFSSQEIVLISGGFGIGSFPRCVILICVEGREGLTPGFFETFDRLVIAIHSSCNNELIILDNSAILQNNFIVLWIVLYYSLSF